MIKRVIVKNYLDEYLYLTLADPEPESGLTIAKIDGLGPVKANINTTEISTGDGTVFNSARVNERNIVFEIWYRLAPSVEDARLLTYKYFPLKKSVVLYFETDNRFVQTVGYVESNEPDIFKENEISTISIICPNPYFFSVEKHDTLFSGIEAAFEFPFDNDSLTENLIEFGTIEIKTSQTITYVGDAEVGIIIRMHAVGKITGTITIYDLTTDGVLRMDNSKIAEITGSGISTSDDVIISTVKGDVYAILIRQGITYNIFNAIDKNADWFQLQRGENVFVYLADAGAEYLEFKIENRIAYEGI